MRQSLNRMKRRCIGISCLALAFAFSVSGGQVRQSEQDRPEGELPTPIRNADDIQFKTSAFTFVRIQYSGVPDWSWSVDWPAADRAFSSQVQSLTGLSVDGDGRVLE